MATHGLSLPHIMARDHLGFMVQIRHTQISEHGLSFHQDVPNHPRAAVQCAPISIKWPESPRVVLQSIRYGENTMTWLATDNGPEYNCQPAGICGGARNRALIFPAFPCCCAAVMWEGVLLLQITLHFQRFSLLCRRLNQGAFLLPSNHTSFFSAFPRCVSSF